MLEATIMDLRGPILVGKTMVVEVEVTNASWIVPMCYKYWVGSE